MHLCLPSKYDQYLVILIIVRGTGGFIFRSHKISIFMTKLVMLSKTEIFSSLLLVKMGGISSQKVSLEIKIKMKAN